MTPDRRRALRAMAEELIGLIDADDPGPEARARITLLGAAHAAFVLALLDEIDRLAEGGDHGRTGTVPIKMDSRGGLA